jgi:hypothetical protein
MRPGLVARIPRKVLSPHLPAPRLGALQALPLPAPLARSTTAVAVRRGGPDRLCFVDPGLRFRGDDGWLAERAQRGQGSTDWLR